jgi:HK97 gp10 family phage protein
MAFKVKMRITGVAELMKKLRSIDEKVKKVALQKGIGAAAKIIKDSAKARVRRRSGQLAKSLGSKVKTFRNTGIVVGVIGPRKGFKIMIDGKPVDPVRYAHLVENGTRRSAAHPFLRPAVEENKDGVFGAIADAVKDATGT